MRAIASALAGPPVTVAKDVRGRRDAVLAAVGNHTPGGRITTTHARGSHCAPQVAGSGRMSSSTSGEGYDSGPCRHPGGRRAIVLARTDEFNTNDMTDLADSDQARVIAPAIPAKASGPAATAKRGAPWLRTAAVAAAYMVAAM